jgi:hypothetical protein
VSRPKGKYLSILETNVVTEYILLYRLTQYSFSAIEEKQKTIEPSQNHINKVLLDTHKGFQLDEIRLVLGVRRQELGDRWLYSTDLRTPICRLIFTRCRAIRSMSIRINS